MTAKTRFIEHAWVRGKVDSDDKNALKMAKSQYLAPEHDQFAVTRGKNDKESFVAAVSWRNVAFFALLHIGAVFGVYHFVFVAKWSTILWTFVCSFINAIGITAGAHRLWAHRSFKATWTGRLFLMLCNCVSFQNDVIEWSRDHRCHHKWTDTNADPHNTNRGFFFSHMGWLLVKKHPEIARQGAKLDLSDLYADEILMFQRRYYGALVVLFCFLIPTAVPVFFWREAALTAFLTASVLRYTWCLHKTWMINSVAHKFGFRPYDTKITPTENFTLSVLAAGEGGHNYHHVFPQDYRTSEYSYFLNATKLVIDAMAFFGMAYSLNVVSQNLIERQKTRQAGRDRSD